MEWRPRGGLWDFDVLRMGEEDSDEPGKETEQLPED